MTAENLKTHEKCEGIVNVLKLVTSEQFPMDNIALHLYLDAVQWFTIPNVTKMTYSSLEYGFIINH